MVAMSLLLRSGLFPGLLRSIRGWRPPHGQFVKLDLKVPELPEVEITARRIGAAVRGATVESTLAPGINALKTFDPPLHALDGRALEGVRRIGKHLVVDVA